MILLYLYKPNDRFRRMSPRLLVDPTIFFIQRCQHGICGHFSVVEKRNFDLLNRTNYRPHNAHQSLTTATYRSACEKSFNIFTIEPFRDGVTSGELYPDVNRVALMARKLVSRYPLITGVLCGSQRVGVRRWGGDAEGQ